MAQIFEDWSGYDIGDNPMVDPPSGAASPEWEHLTLPANVGITQFEVLEDGTEGRFLRVDATPSGESGPRETLASILAGEVLEAEIFTRFRSEFQGSTPRHVRAGFRITGELDEGDGYEVRDNGYRLRRIISGNDTTLQQVSSPPREEHTIYNHLARIEIEGADTRIRTKVWEGHPVDDEPDTWVIDYLDPEANAINVAGKLGPGWQQRGGNDAGIHDLFLVGIGTNGEPAPRAPLPSGQVVQVASVVSQGAWTDEGGGSTDIHLSVRDPAPSTYNISGEAVPDAIVYALEVPDAYVAGEVRLRVTHRREGGAASRRARYELLNAQTEALVQEWTFDSVGAEDSLDLEVTEPIPGHRELLLRVTWEAL